MHEIANLVSFRSITLEERLQTLIRRCARKVPESGLKHAAQGHAVNDREESGC
jgi:hypothetical protein